MLGLERLKLERRQQEARWIRLGTPILALGLTLVTTALLMAMLDKDPWEGLYNVFLLPLADAYGWSELGVKMAPLVLCALGLMVCYRARIWNIGAEGQLLMGALGGSIVALRLGEASGFWVLPLVLLAGMLGGLLWAGIVALLKTRFNCSEILTTIMLNYIAFDLLAYAVHGPLKDPDGFNFPQSAMFSAAATLPPLFEGYRVHWGLVLAGVALVVVWTLLSRHVLGFQWAVLGQDSRAARFAGFSGARLTWLALLICGALSGLAGVGEVAGPIGQLVPQVSPGYGYTAIIAVFLGRMHPLGTVLACALLALTFLGGEMMQMTMGLPKAVAGLIQGMLLFYLLACDLLIGYRLRWRSTRAPMAPSSH